MLINKTPPSLAIAIIMTRRHKKMCGIFGCILKEGNAAPLIHSSLKHLEYRGYDSVGIATISDGKIFIKKDKGKIDEVNEIVNLDDMPGSIGIGHTRCCLLY